MIKLPSVEEILRSSGRTFARFPFVILNAALGTAAALVIVDYEGPPIPSVLIRVLFATLLGIASIAAVTLTAEKHGWGKAAYYAGLVIVVALLTAYAFTVPLQIDNAPNFHFVRLVLLAAAVHFLVAVAPYVGKGGSAGFWQYNRMLAMRFLTTGVFSAVLFGGLAIALAALDNLFGIDVPDRRYAELWVVLAGMFSTWFFFAGIPERLGDLDTATEYPKVVRIFAQYILLPLVMVYAVILYAYAAKILVEWSWPRGWVSGLILGYGTTGILVTLLLHPVRESADHAWIRRATSWFFISLVPLIPMLVLAVLRRVSDYGFTEGRYIALIIGCWLGAIALYFIVSRAKDIRVIPATLCVLAFILAVGPWSAFSVSESSQVGRLRDLLEGRQMLAGGKIVKPAAAVPLEERREMSSILSYLHGVHGFDAIQPWFDGSLREDSAEPGVRYRQPAAVAQMMGLEYVTEWRSEGQSVVTFDALHTGSVDVSGYDRLLRGQYIHRGKQADDFPAEGMRYRVSDGLDSVTLIARQGGVETDSLTIALRPLIDSLLAGYAGMSGHEMAPEKLSVAGESAGMKARLYLRHVTVEKEDGGPKLLSYEAEILYSILPR